MVIIFLEFSGVKSASLDEKLPVGVQSYNETGSRSPCMRPRSDPPKMKNSTTDKIVAEKKNWINK